MGGLVLAQQLNERRGWIPMGRLPARDLTGPVSSRTFTFWAQ